MGQFVVKNTSSLPLSLLSFTTLLANKEVSIKWTTANQVSTKSFSIERSSDGINWSEIGTVSSNNSASINTYSYTDVAPLFGINYYRLKIVDNNANFTYSNVQSIETSSNSFQFNVYPNPARSRLYFNFSDPAYEVYYMRVVNQLGKTIFMLPRPQLQSGLDISTLAKGTYFLQVTDEKTKKTVTKEFVKE